MSWQAFKRRIAESAIEFALNAFWVAVVGFVMTALAAVYAVLKGASPYWLVGLASAAFTLLLVLLITTSIALIKHRRAHGATIQIGKKGFLDYKIQGQRALIRMNRCTAAMTDHMNRMKQQVEAGTRRMQRAQRGGGNTDERAYRAVQRIATGVQKRAGALKLHATNYASDITLFIDGFGKWIEWVVTKGGVSREQLVGVADVLEKLRESMEATIPLLEAYRTAVDESRASSEAMDVAGASLMEVITMIIDSTKAASAFCAAQLPRLRS